MKTMIVSVILCALLSGCGTTHSSSTAASREPSWEQLVSFIGVGRSDAGFRSFASNYHLIEQAKGDNGTFHTDGYSVNLSCQNEIIQGVCVVLRPYYREVKRTYSGELPYGISRDDDLQSIVKKFGEPSSRKKTESIGYELITYKDRNITLGFVNGRLYELRRGDL